MSSARGGGKSPSGGSGGNSPPTPRGGNSPPTRSGGNSPPTRSGGSRQPSGDDGLIAVYAGSFDPVTFGHLDLIERAHAMFAHLIIAIGVHPTKKPLFSFDERVELLRRECAKMARVRIESFDGLLIQYCAKVGARVIVRGLRAATDFEYELQIAHANADLAPQIDTVFLPTRTNYGFVSASLVREIASHGGDVSKYAPAPVCQALRKKFGPTKR